MDLDESRKALISILNMNPKGILADKINKEYKSHCGENIPWSKFGYSSMLVFLSEELKGSIRIDKINELNIMLYPVGTQSSGHMLKLKANENTKKTRRHGHSGQPQNGTARKSSQTAPVQSPFLEPSQEPLDVAETIPTLKRYNPFPKPKPDDNPEDNKSYNNTNAFRNTYLRERLLESQRAYIARQQLLKRAAKQSATPPQNSRTTQSNDRRSQPQSHHSVRSPSNGTSNSHQQRPQLNQTSAPSYSTGMHARFVAALALHEQNKQSQEQSGVADEPNKPEMAPNTSTFQESVGTANTHTDRTVKSAPIQVSDASDDIEKLWEDELENIQPPTLNRSNPSSFYCVSDPTTGSISSKSSIDAVVQHMHLLSSDEDEGRKVSEIPELLNGFQAGDILPARVSDTNNPLKFWIHIRRKEFIAQINDMYTTMQKFYTKNMNSEELKIKSVEEADSGYFAVEFNEQWHRVEPYDTPMGAAIRCQFIDHGTRQTINFNKLRRLDKQFWKTPKAAVCCGLGNIKPIGTTFSTRSANEFVAMVEDQKVYAKILHIDHNRKKAMVELILHKDKTCINDKLVELGYAIPKLMRANA